jgi:glutathione S-transferase
MAAALRQFEALLAGRDQLLGDEFSRARAAAGVW